MEKDELFHFSPGKLYYITKPTINYYYDGIPIYEQQIGNNVIGKLSYNEGFLFTGNVWCNFIQILYENITGWIRISSLTIVKQLK
jgi:hypothetical protein